MWTERRWLPIILGLSLLANVFLLGVVFGHAVAAAHHGRAGPGTRAVWGRTRALAPAEKRSFVDVMRAHRDTIEPKRKALRDAKAAAEAAITAPTYDRAAVETALARVRVAAAAVQEVTQAAVVEALATLSPEARARLFARP